MSDGWVPFREVDFSNGNIKAYHVDTRDFNVLFNDHNPVTDFRKVGKKPTLYIHTPEEIVSLLERLYIESGGRSEWRMLSLTGEGQYRTQNWQMKYLRIYRTDRGLLVTSGDDRDLFVMSKSMLSCPVNQTYLNNH